MAITVVSARSVRVRRSRSQSGKNAPWRSFKNSHVNGAYPGVQLAVAVAVASVGAGLRNGGVVCAAHTVSLGGENVVDEITKHLSHQIWGGLGEQFFEIRGRVDMMRVSGHRGLLSFSRIGKS